MRQGVLCALPFEGDEVALVAAMRAGRADATAAYYDRYVGRVHAVVFRLMGPDFELDDIVHDVFVRALESLGRLESPAALKSWTIGIAVHVVRIRFQKRARQRWLRFMAPDEVPEVAWVADGDARDALREVYAILNGLGTDERIALVLARVDGLGLDEAAAAAGMSVATFRRRLSRAETKFFARAAKRRELERWLTGEEAP